MSEGAAATRRSRLKQSSQELPALVLFAGSTRLKCLRFLRQGFRHCFVAVDLEGGWVILDPLSHRTALSLVSGVSATQLIEWYESQGVRALATTTRAAPDKMAPLAPATCVEAVKRVLGIHARPIRTPWQLYTYLLKNKNKNLDLGPST